MFLLVPLILILASAGGIFFIVWRKFPYLKGASLSGIMADDFDIKKNWRKTAYDFCPEILSWIKSIKFEDRFNEYKELWLLETEKFLRRLRVISLKTDRISGTLIKKIRKNIYSNGNLTYIGKDEEKNGKSKLNMLDQENNREELKKTEQKLILEIAKNPKSVVLYEELGDLYFKMDSYQDAKESYEAATELSPHNEELNKKLSQALEKLNKPEVSQK